MNRRRIVRRVAWPQPTRTAHKQAGTLPRLATKVWRVAAPLLTACGWTGQWSAVESGGIAQRWVTTGHGLSNAGVRLSAPEGARRRVVLPKVPAATLLTTRSLVTKRKKNMNVGIA